MRRWLVVLAVVVAWAPAAAAQDDVAVLFPADTIAYAEVDAKALVAGLPELSLVKVLADPQLREFFKPTFQNLRLDPEKPVASLLERLPVRSYLAGKAAVGVRGLTIRIAPSKGEAFEIRISAARPVDARLVYRVLGLVLRSEWDRDFELDVKIDADFLAVIEPGPRLKELVQKLLDHPDVKRTPLKLGGTEVTHLKIKRAPWDDWNMTAPKELFVSMEPARWLIATNADVLGKALAGGPRASLANAPQHAAVRRRMTRGHRVAFGYLDLAPFGQALHKLVPPLVDEMNEINGLASLRGIGFGLSITEGGVRESVGLVLDGDPKGVWRLLDALPGGLRSIEVAPPGAMAVLAVKFDAELLLQRFREVAAEIVPGNEDLLEKELSAALREVGIDLRRELLPALGDEVGLIAYPGQFLPDVVFGLDLRDEKAFATILEKAKAMATQTGTVRIQPLRITDQVEGFQVLAPLPMQLAFAVHRGHLFGASNPQLLAKVVTEWGTEGARSMRKDDEVFPQVLRGLNGGSGDNVVLLGYFNLRVAFPQAYGMLPMLGIQLPREWVDVTRVPDVHRIARHLSGAAVGLRRDGEGVTLDSFSPAGLLIPGVAYALYEEYERQRRWRRQIVVQPPRQGQASLGISMMSSETGGTGVTVLGMFEHSPLKQAGIRVQDKIIGINEAKITSIEGLTRELAKYKVGQTVMVKVTRGEFQVTLVRAVGR
ncbi:MAG: PDZ domain-containing protein [Planctomycetota bacterium]|jgi:hypothetical protein